MNFQFSTASQIIFGNESISKLASLAKSFGERVMLVTNKNKKDGKSLLDNLSAVGIDILEELEKEGITPALFYVDQEPTIDLIENGLAAARASDSQVFLGLGGGSAVDTAKAISALMANPGSPLDYLEVIGQGKKITQRSKPFIAIPTTSGTGAEVTSNAVLHSIPHNIKVSLRSPMMLAHVALVDPQLTLSLPPSITAHTGLDALTQVIEPFVSSFANPFTDALCREGIQRGGRSLMKAWQDGADAQAREDMSITSLFGGISLANAKLGAVHGFAGVLGGMYGSPHGAICACLLPVVMEMNVKLLEQNGERFYLGRYDEIARILTLNEKARAADGVKWIKELVETMNIPSLSEIGVKQEQFAEIIEKSAKSSSMKGNCLKLSTADLEQILQQAF